MTVICALAKNSVLKKVKFMSSRSPLFSGRCYCPRQFVIFMKTMVNIICGSPVSALLHGNGMQ